MKVEDLVNKDIDDVVRQSLGNMQLESMDLTPEEIIFVKQNTIEEKSYLISLYRAYQKRNEVENHYGKTYHK